MGNQIFFKIAGLVDLTMLTMFAIQTYHLSLIVFEIKNLVEDHPVIISVMLQFHRLSSFWQEDFQNFNQSEHFIGPGSHVGFSICTKITNLVEDLPMNISFKFGLNLFSGFREEDENMKSLQTRTTTTTDAKWWPFGSGELKREKQKLDKALKNPWKT